MQHFREKHNWTLQKTDLTTPSKEIVTVPDEALTVGELLDRANKGIPFGIGKTPIWMDTENFDDPDMEKFAKRDIVDVNADVENISDKGKAAEAQLKAEQEAMRLARIERKKAKGLPPVEERKQGTQDPQKP